MAAVAPAGNAKGEDDGDEKAPAVIVAGAKTHAAFVPGSAAHKAAAKDALMGGLGPTAEIMALDA